MKEIKSVSYDVILMAFAGMGCLSCCPHSVSKGSDSERKDASICLVKLIMINSTFILHKRLLSYILIVNLLQSFAIQIEMI